jgi:hypothetical protein
VRRLGGEVGGLARVGAPVVELVGLVEAVIVGPLGGSHARGSPHQFRRFLLERSLEQVREVRRHLVHRGLVGAEAALAEGPVPVREGRVGEHINEAAPELGVPDLGAGHLAQGDGQVEHLDQGVAGAALGRAGAGDDQRVVEEAVVEARRPLLDQAEVAQVLAVVGVEDAQGAVGDSDALQGRL